MLQKIIGELMNAFDLNKRIDCGRSCVKNNELSSFDTPDDALVYYTLLLNDSTYSWIVFFILLRSLLSLYALLLVVVSGEKLKISSNAVAPLATHCG